MCVFVVSQSTKVGDGKDKEEVQEKDTNQLPQPSSTRTSTSHGYIESPQPTGLTPIRANSGLRTTDVRSRYAKLKCNTYHTRTRLLLLNFKEIRRVLFLLQVHFCL